MEHKYFEKTHVVDNARELYYHKIVIINSRMNPYMCSIINLSFAGL